MLLQLADDRPPIPPPDLILRVAPSFDVNDVDANLQAFDVGALTHLQSFENALAGLGHSLSDFDRLLDFGCGCGRFLRHLGFLAGAVDIHGTDIDAQMIEWLRANVPYGSYDVAPHEPPMPYPDGYFDLIINHSVFTHLDEQFQDLWLAELQRISRPGGFVLLTVEGTASWNRTLQAHQEKGQDVSRWQEELESRGILYIRDDSFIGSTHPDFYHSTFHAPWYVFEHWTRFFELGAYLPEGSDSQDLIVLRRREEGSTSRRPIHARPAQPAPVQGDLVQVSRQAATRLRSRLRPRGRSEPRAVDRELAMLRAGLYEQANRISVLAAELRSEIDQVRDPEHSSSGSGTPS